MDRRSFVKGAAAGVGATALGAGGAKADLVNWVLSTAGVETQKGRTPVQHLVVLMMENRSVDHFLGWHGAENPDYDAIQEASFPDLRQPGAPLTPTELWGLNGRRNYHGRGYADPDHGWNGGRHELNGGANDGWLDPRTGNDEFCLSYYDAIDIPFWAQLVRDYQTYDRWFCSVLAPTYPNRFYMHSATSAGFKGNSLPPEVAADNPQWTLGWDWPTIWTLLADAGITAKYYFSNLPVLAMWGPRHLNHHRHVADYFADCLLGQLPQVSFVDPWFTLPEGLANDDHPHADIRLGQAFLSDCIEAFVNSPHYRNGAFIVNYDEWGGFWDHVPPPRLPDDRATDADPGGADDFGQLGFRIPTTIISPWTRGNAVDHTVYDHTSILKFISENWGLGYLTTRHQGTNSIESAFRGFTSYDPEPRLQPYEAPLEVVLEPTLEDLGLNPHDRTAGTELFRLAEMGWFDGLGLDLSHRFEDSFLHRRPELLASAARGLGLLGL